MRGRKRLRKKKAKAEQLRAGGVLTWERAKRFWKLVEEQLAIDLTVATAVAEGRDRTAVRVPYR